MNTDKISKFITKKRKEKKLTQQELADLTHLSEKTISKWECGRGIPDIGNLQALSKALDVSVTELLNGEEEKKEEPVIEYIEYKEKKSSKKILILSIISILLLTIAILGMYFFNNYGKTKVYLLSGKGKHFYYNNLVVIKSNSGNIIGVGSLGDDQNYKYEIIGVNLSMNNYDYGTLGTKPNVISEKITGTGIIPNTAYDRVDNWEIVVTYQIEGENPEGEYYEEVIKLEPKEVISGNRFTKEKLETREEKIEKRKETMLQSYEEIREYLLSKDGINVVRTEEQGMLIIKKDINKNENIDIRGIPSDSFQRFNFYYKYQDENIYLIAQFDQGFGKKYDKILFYGKNKNEEFNFRYIVNDNKATCTYGKCPKNIQEMGKRFVDTIDKEFYELDIFDRDETCDCYQIINEDDSDV